MGGKSPAACKVPKDSRPGLAAHAAEHTGDDAVVGFQGVDLPWLWGNMFSGHSFFLSFKQKSSIPITAVFTAAITAVIFMSLFNF